MPPFTDSIEIDRPREDVWRAIGARPGWCEGSLDTRARSEQYPRPETHDGHSHRTIAPVDAHVTPLAGPERAASIAPRARSVRVLTTSVARGGGGAGSRFGGAVWGTRTVSGPAGHPGRQPDQKGGERVLAITESAASAIKDLATARDQPEDAGVRISARTDIDVNTPQSLELSLADGPAPDDEVIDEQGAHVFVESRAAGYLDDKLLDAHVEGEQVRFTVSDQRS